MRISVTVLAAVSAAALAGCGGSGATSSAPGSAASTRSPSSTVKTVTRTATATATASSTSTAATTTAGTATSAGAGGGPASCRQAGLALSFLGQQGATGHGELGFALRSTGAASCSTFGYPGVQFIDRSGAPLPTTPTHTTHDFFGVVPLRPLVVGAGQTVTFRLGVTHGLGSSAGCTTAYGLRVIAPNDTATLQVSIPGGAAECGTTTVSPLRPGNLAYP